MAQIKNKGFDPHVIAELKQKLDSVNLTFVPVEEEDNSDEYFHFQFVGKSNGAEVIYDAAMYTLRLEHESELLELAEEQAAQHFPNYEELKTQIESGNSDKAMEALEEEVGLFIADVMMELQEEGSIKVQEHVDIDEEASFGISLDIGLNVESITPPILQKFIQDFNTDSLVLDPTLYSFEIDKEDED